MLINKVILTTKKGLNIETDLDVKVIVKNIKALKETEDVLLAIQVPKQLPKDHKLQSALSAWELAYDIIETDDIKYEKIGGGLTLDRWMSESYRTGTNKQGNSREVQFRDDKDFIFWEDAFVLYNKFKDDVKKLREDTKHEDGSYLWESNVISCYCQRTNNATKDKETKEIESPKVETPTKEDEDDVNDN